MPQRWRRLYPLLGGGAHGRYLITIPFPQHHAQLATRLCRVQVGLAAHPTAPVSTWVELHIFPAYIEFNVKCTS
jgi:hypothetical protein